MNIDDRTVNLVSIPRDTRAYLPLSGRESKINHAFAYSGIDGTVEAVEHLFNIPVDYYVQFNFESFIHIIDSLGGIEMYVPMSFSELDSNDRRNAIHLEQGYQTLNGEEALALARTRRFDSDIQRGQRQQQIIKAVMDKAMSINSVPLISDIIEAIEGNFRTNLTFSGILSFYQYGMGATIQNIQLRGQDAYISSSGQIFDRPGLGGIYYYLPYQDSVMEISRTLNAHLRGIHIPNTNQVVLSEQENIFNYNNEIAN